MPDNYSLWEFNEAKMEAWLRSRPACCRCGHPIQDEEMFDIHGDFFHIYCAKEEFCVQTEDYAS